MDQPAVLVTGASTGIGEACAIYLAAQNWQVFTGVRKEADAQRLKSHSANITPILIDITKSEEISSAARKIRAAVGETGLHGLVNNAGIALASPIEFLKISELRRQVEVNFIAHVEVTQMFLPLLRKGRGRVVNMSSISGRITSPFLMPYSTSKFAIEAFSDGLRRELRPWGLHVAAVEPGPIATPIWKKAVDTAQHTRADLPPQAEALYGPAMRIMLEGAQKAGENGVSAEEVAKAVHHALTSDRPKTRYQVGKGVRFAVFFLRLLPDSLIDWFLTRKLYK